MAPKSLRIFVTTFQCPLSGLPMMMMMKKRIRWTPPRARQSVRHANRSSSVVPERKESGAPLLRCVSSEPAERHGPLAWNAGERGRTVERANGRADRSKEVNQHKLVLLALPSLLPFPFPFPPPTPPTPRTHSSSLSRAPTRLNAPRNALDTLPVVGLRCHPHRVSVADAARSRPRCIS